METYFIEFERGDRVRVRGDLGVFTVIEVDWRGAPKYDPRIAKAYLEGNGIRQVIAVKDLELAT